MAFQSSAFQNNAFQITVPVGAVVGGGAGEIIRIETFSRKRWREFLKERRRERELVEAREREAQDEEDAILLLLLSGDGSPSFVMPDEQEAPQTDQPMLVFTGDETDEELAELLLLAVS